MRNRKIFDLERVVRDKRFVFKVCIDLANATPPLSLKKSRGHPPTYSGALYLAALLFKFYFNLTFGQAQMDLLLLSPKVPWVQDPLIGL
jgi:hypothetical protein